MKALNIHHIHGCQHGDIIVCKLVLMPLSMLVSTSNKERKKERINVTNGGAVHFFDGYDNNLSFSSQLGPCLWVFDNLAWTQYMCTVMPLIRRNVQYVLQPCQYLLMTLWHHLMIIVCMSNEERCSKWIQPFPPPFDQVQSLIILFPPPPSSYTNSFHPSFA